MKSLFYGVDVGSEEKMITHSNKQDDGSSGASPPDLARKNTFNPFAVPEPTPIQPPTTPKPTPTPTLAPTSLGSRRSSPSAPAFTNPNISKNSNTTNNSNHTLQKKTSGKRASLNPFDF